MTTPQFCDECGVSMDLHYGDDDCDGARARADVNDAFAVIVWNARHGDAS